jgi:hypothetical protein
MGVAHELRGIEVDLAQVAAGVARGRVVEVRRVEMAALAAGGDGHRSHALAELVERGSPHGSDEDRH